MSRVWRLHTKPKVSVKNKLEDKVADEIMKRKIVAIGWTLREDIYNELTNEDKIKLEESENSIKSDFEKYKEIIEKNSISKCRDFLTGQIALLNPSYIVTVGENPTRSFIKEKEDIKEMVGNSYRYIGDMWIVPIFDIPYLFKATDKEKWKLIKILTKLEKSVEL